MDACRRKANEHVAILYGFPGDYLVPVYDADAKSGQIIVVFGIKAGHFSGFTAEERTARFFAGMGNALDDGSDLDRIQFADGNVIEEKQRFRTLYEHVVDGHGNAVLTDCIMLVHHDSQAQFRPNPVGTADENRFLYLAVHKGKESAKSAEVTEYFRAVRRLYRIFHEFYGFVAGIDIYASVCIGQTFFIREHIFLLPHWSQECLSDSHY